MDRVDSKASKELELHEYEGNSTDQSGRPVSRFAALGVRETLRLFKKNVFICVLVLMITMNDGCASVLSHFLSTLTEPSRCQQLSDLHSWPDDRQHRVYSVRGGPNDPAVVLRLTTLRSVNSPLRRPPTARPLVSRHTSPACAASADVPRRSVCQRRRRLVRYLQRSLHRHFAPLALVRRRSCLPSRRCTDIHHQPPASMTLPAEKLAWLSSALRVSLVPSLPW